MPLSKTLLGYLNAVHTAAHGRPTRYPYAVYSVLASRLQHGLGPRYHSLFNLADIPRDQWDDYMADDRLRPVLLSMNQFDARVVTIDKLAFHDHCVAHSLPTIPVICAVNYDGSFPESLATVETAEQWCDRLEKAPDQLFVKLIDGTWGIDAFVAQRKDNQWHYAGNSGSAVTFFDFLKQREQSVGRKMGWIVQPLIEADESLKAITSPRALPTIRVNTCLVDGQARLLFAALRIPVGDNFTDNFSHGASGNIIAPIDMDTGRLGKASGSLSKRWPNIVDVPVHPDTGVTIEGQSIAMWNDVLDLVERGQKSLPALSTLGWDITVTDNGPLIVETNATYDVDLIQVAHRRGVGPQLKEAFPSWFDADGGAQNSTPGQLGRSEG